MHNVYPDELLYFIDVIKKRQLQDTIKQIRIVANPHSDKRKQEEFADELMAEQRQLYGFVDMEATLDKEGFNELKEYLQKKSQSIRVK